MKQRTEEQLKREIRQLKFTLKYRDLQVKKLEKEKQVLTIQLDESMEDTKWCHKEIDILRNEIS